MYFLQESSGRTAYTETVTLECNESVINGGMASFFSQSVEGKDKQRNHVDYFDFNSESANDDLTFVPVRGRKGKQPTPIILEL